jgi:hypothetical protein
VDSALGEGSTFIVTLPQDVSATPHINPGEHLAVKVAV